MRRQRGQASVELVACALVLALAAIGAVQALVIVRTRVEAERIADQAAVVAAEGRSIPASLRRRASIELRGERLVVSVPVPLRLPGAPEAEVVTTRVGP